MCAKCFSLVFEQRMSKVKIHFHWSVLRVLGYRIRHFSVLLFWKRLKITVFAVFTVSHNPVCQKHL